MPINQTFKANDGKTLPCADGQTRTEYIEPGTKLRLRVSRTGDRAWSIQYWSPVVKKPRRLTIGDASKMALSEAHKKARSAFHAVESEGRDPFADQLAARDREREARKRRAAERRLAADERAHSTTFGEVCRKYIEYRRTVPGGRTRRTASKRTLSIGESILKNYIEPTIFNRLPQTLTSEDFVVVLEAAVKRGPSMPRNVLGFLSAAWRWMESRHRALGVRLPAQSPLVGLPLIGADRGERDRYLSQAEIWRFWRATEDAGLAGSALRFILMTGCRVKEATCLPWSEVNLKAKVWTLPAARNKSARERSIPLSKQALAVLDKADSEGEFAFRRVQLNEPIKAIRAAMGVYDWEPRDLRRTAATTLASKGVDEFVVSLALGHRNASRRTPDVTRIYQRWDYAAQVRKALDKLGSEIEKTVSSEKEPGELLTFEVSGRS